jgi:hypothetical protein
MGQDSFGHYAALRSSMRARRRTVEVAPKSIFGQVNSLTVTPDGSRLITRRIHAPEWIDLIQFQ